MPSTRISLPGSDRKPIAHAENLGPADPAEQAYVTVIVRRKTELLPITAANTLFDRQQYTLAHGASASDLLAVGEFAKEYGLKTRNESAGARSVELHGSVRDLSRAFDVSLHRGRIADQVYRVREGHIAIPIELAEIIQAVLGLDDRPAAKPFSRRRAALGARTSTGAHALSPRAVAELYNFPLDLDGSGQTIAIIELDGGFLHSDLVDYCQDAGLPIPPVRAVLLDGQTNEIDKHLPAHPELNADDEVALAMQVAAAIAPQAKQVVYFAKNTDQSFLKAIQCAISAKPQPVAVSIGWGMVESDFSDQAKISFEQALQDAANLGIAVCVATGDSGAFDETGAPAVNFPASAPHALACGGTRLTGSGGTISSETVWNSLVSDGMGGSLRTGSGGGVSTFFSKPTYQDSAQVPDRPTGFGEGRGVPDVCGNADPETGYLIHVKGIGAIVGGTSAVAPLWAGLLARFGQHLGKPVGFLHPQIYKPEVSKAAFQDIVTGDNDSQGKSGIYRAGPGWDPCTGLGSPNGRLLLQALGGPVPAPQPKPTPAPTPFPEPVRLPTPVSLPSFPKPVRPPAPVPVPVPVPQPAHTAGTVFTAPPAPVFAPLPPQRRKPVSVVSRPLPAAPLVAGASSVACTAVLGVAAVMGMIAATGVVAVTAIHRDNRN